MMNAAGDLSPHAVLQLYRPHDYSVVDAIQSRISGDADRFFMHAAGRQWSWAETARQADLLARAFHRRGIRHGDRVAVIGRNGPTHVLALLALGRIGAIMVPVNSEFSAREMSHVLGDAAVSAVIVEESLRAIAMQACADRAIAPWFATTDEIASMDWLDAQPTEVIADRPGGADDTVLLIYTSGTTGFPKGVMHSQRSFLSAGEAFVQRMHLQQSDALLIILPLFHINALFYSVSGTIAAGARMIIAPRFSASAFWPHAAETGATVVNVIEAIGSILANRARNEYRPDHQIRKVYGLREEAARVFREVFGIPHLIAGYGMTEIPGAIANPFDGLQKPGSMGIIGRHPDPARPWAECRVVDDHGADLPADKVGELLVRTPVLMQGYFRDPQQTAAAFIDGWFRTGDLVRRDADGYFFFVSRRKDIIRRRGENIAGAELDRVLCENPAIQEAAAIGVPSELGEEDIMAVVLPRPGAQLTPGAVLDWCAGRLAPIKYPRYVLLVDEMPHTATHKVAKSMLRADPTLRERATDMTATTAG